MDFIKILTMQKFAKFVFIDCISATTEKNEQQNSENAVKQIYQRIGKIYQITNSKKTLYPFAKLSTNSKASTKNQFAQPQTMQIYIAIQKSIGLYGLQSWH